MLDREPNLSAGLGFCGEALPLLLPQSRHGPVLIALDSNILIDLETWGAEILEESDSVSYRLLDEVYQAELSATAEIVYAWMLRDIRFSITERALTDAKSEISEQRRTRRIETVESIRRSLCYQLDEWGNGGLRIDPLADGTMVEVTGIPLGADADLLREAQSDGADVFLTRDKRLLRHARVRRGNNSLRVLAPSSVAGALREAQVTPFKGGICRRECCPYYEWTLPAPDMGKWEGLLSVLGTA